MACQDDAVIARKERRVRDDVHPIMPGRYNLMRTAARHPP
jgi:hypothetical protein